MKIAVSIILTISGLFSMAHLHLTLPAFIEESRLRQNLKFVKTIALNDQMFGQLGMPGYITMYVT